MQYPGIGGEKPRQQGGAGCRRLAGERGASCAARGRGNCRPCLSSSPSCWR